jgi:hypothetical protein
MSCIFWSNTKKEVRWYIALKAPGGETYQSIQSGSKTKVFEPGENINTWLANTFLHTVDDDDECGEIVLAYNDQIPLKGTGGNGHCKGVVVRTKHRLRWLIHSVPNWPLSTSSSTAAASELPQIPFSETIFGQSFVILETPIAVSETVWKQIRQIEPNVYFVHPDLGDHVTHKKRQRAEISVVTFRDGVTHVAKDGAWDRCLFHDLCERFRTGCYCETWGRPILPETEVVRHIAKVKWGKNDYKRTQDHSKLAISSTRKRPWIYIGDINYQGSQHKRGGGGLIIENEKLWTQMHGILYVEQNF